MLRKNSFPLGLIIGVLIPAIMFIVLTFGQTLIVGTFTDGIEILSRSMIEIIALFFNVLVFRYYMIKLEYDYTGRGMLLATFIYAAIFCFEHRELFN